MLLAAMLLSVSAFAQSGNNEPLKGDVNGDGTVDVADIAAIIEIMKNGGGTGEQTTYYFSVGTTPPDASNYTTVNGATTTIPTTQTYTNNSGAKASIYVLVPSNKTVTATDPYLNIPSPMIELTSVSIPNHKVYVTVDDEGNIGKIAKGSSIKITLN